MNKELNNIELQAEIIRQDHRWFSIFRNFLIERRKYDKEDPRYKACKDALLFKVISTIVPIIIYGTLGISTILALVISVQTLLSIQEQNVIESRAFLFEHARDIQKVFVDEPELYKYFYHNVPVSDTLSQTEKDKISVVSEMIADMLDNAAGSRIRDLSEGWSEYANFMIDSSPAFKNFYEENKDWYPAIDKLLNMDTIPVPKSRMDKIKKYIEEI